MLYKHFYAKDLAKVVMLELKGAGSACPRLESLITLFETMYSASLMVEELQSITFQVVYLDPKNPDPKPPPRIRKNRWRYFRLTEPISITPSNLIKLAKASDSRTSSFAVYSDPQSGLAVWGIIDQGNTHHDFINYESDSGFPLPGVFHISIRGPGDLVVSTRDGIIAELKVSALIRNSLDVLNSGPILMMLGPGIQAYQKRVKSALPAHILGTQSRWDIRFLANEWIESICRLLLRVKNYQHGGAVLITPDKSFAGLNVKYRIQYERLMTALETYADLSTRKRFVETRILGAQINRMEKKTGKRINIQVFGSKKFPRTTVSDPQFIDLYEELRSLEDDLDDSKKELEGTIWFISLLTRVDGLVLLNLNLEVQGFGVEITQDEKPSVIFRAGDSRATKMNLAKDDYNRLGTRHRSMMRYCAKVPGSVGFVISQDGDVRVMTQVRGKLVIWENIKLQLLDFVRCKQREGMLKRVTGYFIGGEKQV